MSVVLALIALAAVTNSAHVFSYGGLFWPLPSWRSALKLHIACRVGFLSIMLRGGAKGGKKNKRSAKDATSISKGGNSDEIAPATSEKSAKELLMESKTISSNALLVEDSVTDDHSTIGLSAGKMDELGLFSGDTVLIKGKKRKDTVAVVNTDESVPDSRVRMSKVV